MLFPEQDAPVLKTWIVKRLETPSRTDSDVDADVLADYVLALLRHDGDSSTVQQLCVTELYDFLRDEAGPFVNDVFQALAYKSYRPGARPPPPPQPSQRPDTTKASLLPTATGKQAIVSPTMASFGYGITGAVTGLADDTSDGESRKRGYQDSTLYATGPNERSAKQARRGGSFRGGRANGHGTSSEASLHAAAALLPETPVYPVGGAFGAPPPEEILRLQQQLGLSAPMYGGFGTTPMMGKQPDASGRQRRCRNMDKKGTCSKPNCPFDHGDAATGVGSGMHADAFSQFQQAGLFPFFPPMPGQFFDPQQQQQQQQQFPQPGGMRRSRRGDKSQFSTDGPVFDESKSTIVVEGIPADYLSKDAVEQFFSQFGKIDRVKVDVPQSLAIVKFASWDEANAAYQSPKVIFDNRFVKVFWHKDEAANGHGHSAGVDGAEPEVDMEEVQRKQEEAQRAYEERLRQRQELDQQREELGERMKDLLAKQAKERQKLIAMMAMAAAKVKGRQGGGSSSTDSEGEAGGADIPTKVAALTQTDLIRAQLAALEEEARMLGLDPEAMRGGDDASSDNAEFNNNNNNNNTWDGDKPRIWPSRGGHTARGRGSFYRGGGRGSSYVRGGNASLYAAYSLDNRPRRVAISGVDFTSPDKNEALRQYLLGVGDFAAIDTTDDAATITFKDRRTAEQFYYSLPRAQESNNGTQPSQSLPRKIPGIDAPVEIQWVANTAKMATSAGRQASGQNDSKDNGSTASGVGSFIINTMDDDEDADNGGNGDGHGHDHDHGYQDREDGEIDDDRDDDRRRHLHLQNMDFDVAGDDGGWDIA